MKKVVFEEQQKTASISELKDDSFVGIIFNHGKSVIAKNSLGFFGYSKDDLDFTGRWYKPTLLDYVLSFDNPKEVFLFDTKEELFIWLNS